MPGLEVDATVRDEEVSDRLGGESDLRQRFGKGKNHPTGSGSVAGHDCL